MNLLTGIFADEFSAAHIRLQLFGNPHRTVGLLMVFRTAIQSMGNSRTPFEACVIELVMRILGSVGLAALLAPYGLSYTGICLSHTLAWLGATALLMPVYFRQMKALPLSQ